MKAEELRLNNIVSDGIFQFYITEITKGVIKGLLIDFQKSSDEIQDEIRLNATYSLNIENIVGIPLTEEWLIKFGFKNAGIWEDYMPYFAKDGVLLFFNEGRTEYELSDYLSGYGEMRSGKYHFTTFKWIKSVHQLQNLYYCLTGTELTIK